MGYRTPTCPIAKRCGGCEWLSVPYPIQLERKRAAVLELYQGFFAARRHPLTADTVEIHGMERPVGFRHKAATPFAPGKNGAILSGFYARGTHHIVRCQACLTEDKRARPILERVAREAERLKITAYTEDAGRGMLRHTIVRTGWKSNEGLLTIVCNGNTLARGHELAERVAKNSPLKLSVVQNINQRITNAMLGSTNKTLLGSGVMHDSLLGVTFEIGPSSFYQTNPRQTEVLYRLAIEMAQLEPGMRLLDAYSGIGTIGLCAAKLVGGLEVTGVERTPSAVANARKNARINGLTNQARFIAQDATEYMRHATKEQVPFDVVVLDPPRAGATPEFLDGVAQLAPERVVYISCNPVTQARDVQILADKGYALEALTCVDMFPHTKHVETVALLTR